MTMIRLDGCTTFILSLVLLFTTSAGLVDDEESFLSMDETDSPARELFYSFGEFACRRDLRTCLDKRGPGNLSIDAWAAFLGEPSSEDSEEDTELNQLRFILEQASLVDFTEIFEELKSGTNEDSAARTVESASGIMASIKAHADDSDGVGPIGEDNVEEFLNFFNGLQDTIYNSFDPPLRDLLSLLVNIIFLPIIKPLGIIFSISVFLAYLRRPFVREHFLRSSTECEAEHLKCEYEGFLMDTIPALLKEEFIHAGVSPP